MSEMINRIAATMHHEEMEMNNFVVVSVGSNPFPVSSFFKSMTEAAIEAMLEPTQKMLEAGETAVCKDQACCCNPGDIYGAMIKEALKP